MKNLLLFFALIVGFVSTQAQDNPFAEYGYTPKIATLSQGQFNESFDNDTIVQIGSVLFNTKSKQIVAFVEYDTLYSEATLEPDIVSRWMSPDPLADHPNQIGLSPYQYAWNNPIYWTDPDGRCPLCPWADAIIDIGFALYDVGEIIYDYTTTGEVDPISVAALTADLGSIFIPMSTGAGLAVRAGYHATKTGVKTTAKIAIKSADGVKDITKQVFKKYDIDPKQALVTPGRKDAKSIVVGRQQTRVEGFADEIGAETFDVYKYAKQNKIDLRINKNGRIDNDQLLDINKQWIKEKKDAGYNIYDIGNPASNPDITPSPYYNAEKEIIYN